jgi:hypothetical protein
MQGFSRKIKTGVLTRASRANVSAVCSISDPSGSYIVNPIHNIDVSNPGVGYLLPAN